MTKGKEGKEMAGEIGGFGCVSYDRLMLTMYVTCECPGLYLLLRCLLNRSFCCL